MKAWATLAALAAATAVIGSGCSIYHVMSLSVTGPQEAPVIRARQEMSQDAPCIRKLSVSAGEPARTLWTIERSECAPLGPVVYGQLPEGFTEAGPALPIPSGQVLRAEVERRLGDQARNSWCFQDGSWVVGNPSDCAPG